MFSWNSIRYLSAVLLALPLLHLAYKLASEFSESMTPGPDVWHPYLEAYVEEDLDRALPDEPLLVVGGRLVRLWPDLESSLAPVPVLTRGFPDAIIEDLEHHYSRLIGFYRPHTLVILPGAAEFHLRDNKSGEELVHGIQRLARLNFGHGITERLYVFAPLLTPRFPEDRARVRRATELLGSWAAADPRVSLLDGNRLLADAEGRPAAQYFRTDGIHLSDTGFQHMAVLLKSQMLSHRPDVFEGP